MTALQVRGLAVSLAGRPVLHDVDLDVAAGQFVGLLGPNGAGKTTLLRAILRLVTSTGEVRVDGGPARRGHSGLGYVPQRHEFAWDFPISVQDVVMTGRRANIGWFRQPRAADHRAVADALELVDMSSLRRRPVGQLSGGQRQRVLIARALACQPTVLLLDEPFTGLDMPTQESLSGLFARLAADGRAVLMTTHDLLGALASCDRLYLINRTIVASGPPSELHDRQLWIDTFEMTAANPLLTVLAGR